MRWSWIVILALTWMPAAQAGVGDPQLRTDEPWYPGELAVSTFERLFATQAEVYERVVGVRPVTDEQKALAAWLWRNTHYFHGEEGPENLWGKGFQEGGDLRSREYWTGLFAHGFGLCGTTHSQWVAEMNALLGHGRGRGVGTHGHNAFEVFLTGGAYGKGKWALLDHDLSTVIFDKKGESLLSVQEIHQDWKRWTSRSYLPDRQPWLVCGLHPDDGSSYQRYAVAEYLAGYSGAPPMVHLRRGESLRRYFQPGLEDGKTFVFWGRNYNAGGIPGPERSMTWVNQPERMYKSQAGPGYRPGQARYANAVYTYKPDFATGDYREGVIDEGYDHIAFEFYTPYIIGATPPTDSAWGIFEPGCRNGLVLRGQARCAVSISTDQGQTWLDCGQFTDGLDLTDLVKGHRKYFLKLHAGAAQLQNAGLTMTTVCQANASILPRLKDGETEVTFQASGQAVISAGPNLQQAQAHLVAGKFGTPRVTLELSTPRKEPVVAIHAAAHVLSGNPPDPAVKYQIESSIDTGETWQPQVKDWTVPRRGDEPKDFWSQSLCWGSATLSECGVSRVQIRFHNDGGKSYARAELHLVYRAAKPAATRVTYAWSNDRGPQRASRVFEEHHQPQSWQLSTGRQPQTHWVEMEAR
jgi:hypothetical protein